MTMSPDLLALAFCVMTETNRDEEMPYVAGVIVNRVDHQIRGKSVRDVVLAPYQFSAFNGQREERLALQAEKPQEAVEALILRSRRYSTGLFNLAVAAAYDALAPEGNPWRNGLVNHPRAAYVHHYYSPVSMPADRPRPSWFDADKEVLVPGIDAHRFRWFHDVH